MQKNLKMEFNKIAKIWHFYSLTEILIIGWHTEIWKRLCEKDQGIKIKDSGGAYDINQVTDVLTWIHSVKRTLQHFCFIFSHLNYSINWKWKKWI